MSARLAATLLLLQLLCQVLVTVECGCELPSGYIKYPGDNTAYKFNEEVLTWNEARDRCIAEGAHLAIINTTDKLRQMHISLPKLASFWIGVHRPTPGSDWVRVDTGLPIIGSIPWSGYNPEYSFWNCAMIENVKSGGNMAKYYCYSKFPSVCEMSLAEGCPSPVGPQGSQGTQGLKGDTGSPGVAGPKGEKGEPGESGSNGSAGPPGKDGLKGDAGAPGPRGSTGLIGEPGLVGPQGLQGPPGLKGDSGSPGVAGSQGGEGGKGEPGVPGIPGKLGEHGDDGFPGPEGLPGPAGENGRRGPAGPPGSRGPRGPIGPAGPSGLLGPAGDPGVDGEPGAPGLPGLPGMKGDKGDRGLPGIGLAGPPGPGYNATWLALLAACQEQSQGSDLIDGGKSATGPRNFIIVKEECEEFIAKAYEQERLAFRNFIEPEVRKESTAKTCRDLFNTHPDKPSGKYWIDPSVDGTSNKMLVYCDAETRSTCITPAINQSQVITYEGEEQEVWLSQHEMGMQIVYKANSNQISALQLLSSHAEQKVTYHCMQSVGYFDAEGQTYDRGLKLSAWTEVEITPRGRQRLRYDVISDECQNRSNEWRETVIAYRTDKPVLLPVVDVALRDLGKPEKRAIVEIGDVCFSLT